MGKHSSAPSPNGTEPQKTPQTERFRSIRPCLKPLSNPNCTKHSPAPWFLTFVISKTEPHEPAAGLQANPTFLVWRTTGGSKKPRSAKEGMGWKVWLTSTNPFFRPTAAFHLNRDHPRLSDCPPRALSVFNGCCGFGWGFLGGCLGWPGLFNIVCPGRLPPSPPLWLRRLVDLKCDQARRQRWGWRTA